MIQEHPVINFAVVSIYDGVHTEYDCQANVLNMSMSRGGTIEPGGTQLQVGSLTFTLLNPTVTWMAPGANVTVDDNTSSSFGSFFTGTIQDIVKTKVFNPTTATFDSYWSFTCVDQVANAQKIIVPEKATISQADETQTVDDLVTGQLYNASGGTFMPQLTANVTSTTLVNQSADSESVTDIMDNVARTIRGHWFIDKADTPTLTKHSSSDPYKITFTDGTHSTIHGSRLDMIQCEWGYDTARIVTQLKLTSQGLKVAPTDVSVLGKIQQQDISIDYTSAAPVAHAYEYKVRPAMDNLGWNFIEQTCTDGNVPTTWGTTNTYFGFYPVDPTVMADNGHAVIRARVSGASLPAGNGFTFSPVDESNNFVTSTPGGATGAWRASVRVRAVAGYSFTLRLNIAWYDATGTLVTTTTGTNTSVTSSAWSTLTTTLTTAPSGAVTAVMVLVSNVLVNPPAAFYVSEPYFTRAGTSTTFFDGSTAATSSYVYAWTGTPYNSASQKSVNGLDSIASDILSSSTAVDRVKTITVNAQQNINLVSETELQSKVSVALAGTQTDYYIAGISHNVTPTSWMTTYVLCQ